MIELLIFLTLMSLFNMEKYMKYDLLVLQKFYIENLSNHSFVFETSVGKIVIKFDKANFCHLLGLHYFNKNYKGIKGWNDIEQKNITHSKLKQIDKNKYENTFKIRSDVLYKANDILKQCKRIKIFKNIYDTPFQCDFLLYQHSERKYYVITTFIDSITNEYCAGSSFLQYHDSSPSCIKYLAPLDNDIEVFNYSIDFYNKSKNKLFQNDSGLVIV